MKSQVSWSRMLVVGVVSLLVACGGGGGGGDGGGGAGGPAAGSADTATGPGTTPAPASVEVFKGISLTRTSSAEQQETSYVGARLPMLFVTASYTMTVQAIPGNTLYTRVVGADPRIFDLTSGKIMIDQVRQNAVLTLRGLDKHSLPPGVYTNDMKIEVCLDAECTVQLAGSPLAVTYRLEVKPAIDILPVKIVDLRGVPNVEGARVEVPLNVPVPADTPPKIWGPLGLVLEDTSGWNVAGPLDAQPAPIVIGQLPTNTKFTITPQAAPAGTYRGRYLVSWQGVEAILVVNYVVAP